MTIVRVVDDPDGAVAELFVEYRHFYGRSDDDADARSYFRERLARADSLVWAARSAGGVDGFVQVYVHHSSLALATDWVLNDLFVGPTGRGKSVGKALVLRVVDEARAAGARLVELETQHDNTTARALYDGLGFSVRSSQPDADGFVTYVLPTAASGNGVLAG